MIEQFGSTNHTLIALGLFRIFAVLLETNVAAS